MPSRQAVGGDEDALARAPRRASTRASRSSAASRPVTASTVDVFGRALRSAVGDVLGGGDEAAEDDRLVAVRERAPSRSSMPFASFASVVARRAPRRRRASSRSRRAWTRGSPRRSRSGRRPGRRRLPSTLSSSMVEDASAGRSRRPRRRLVGLGASGSRSRRVAAAAAGLEPIDRRSARADHQRTRWRRSLPAGSRTISRA